MTGVEILAFEEIVVKRVFNFKVFAIVGGIVFLIFFIYCIFDTYYPDVSEVLGIIFAGLFIGGFLGGILGAVAARPVEYTTEYKVIVDEEVSMLEFLERYEIVDSEGKILIVREINGE